MKTKMKFTGAVLMYCLFLGTIAANWIVIQKCKNTEISYYYGSLLFLPIFIGSYWTSIAYSALSVNETAWPKFLRKALIIIGEILCISLILYWVVIYMNDPEMELF